MRQCWPAVAITNMYMGRSWALAYFTVLSLSQDFILHMLLSHAVALAPFLLPAFPSLWMFFGKYYEHFSTEGLSVVVPEGCHSQGCHSYLPGLLGVPFSFTRHLLYTYIYVLSIGFRDRGARWKVGGLTIENNFSINDQHTRSVQIQCKKRRDYNFSIENTTLKWSEKFLTMAVQAFTVQVM